MKSVEDYKYGLQIRRRNSWWCRCTNMVRLTPVNESITLLLVYFIYLRATLRIFHVLTMTYKHFIGIFSYVCNRCDKAMEGNLSVC